MIKRVKGGRIKHYCDKCGVPTYDEIPQTPTVQFLGMWIPEVKIRRYKPTQIVKASKAKGTSAGEYCKDCFDEINKEP